MTSKVVRIDSEVLDKLKAIDQDINAAVTKLLQPVTPLLQSVTNPVTKMLQPVTIPVTPVTDVTKLLQEQTERIKAMEIDIRQLIFRLEPDSAEDIKRLMRLIRAFTATHRFMDSTGRYLEIVPREWGENKNETVVQP